MPRPQSFRPLNDEHLERRCPFNPQMLRLARNYHGLTKKALAQKITVSPAFVTLVEDGIKVPSTETMNRLVAMLGFPKSFYQQTGFIEAVPTSFFRRRLRLNKSIMLQCTARMALFKRCLGLLLEEVEGPDLRLPRIDPGEHLEGTRGVAKLTRRALRIPLGPIYNLTEILESSGVLVVPFDFGTMKIDGCSDWVGDVPFILFNPAIPRSRLRHTLAHELGHLVMHDVIAEDCEIEANEFAAELNMPASEIRHQLLPVRIENLARLKIHWKCSMSALLYRAFDLGLISPRKKRYYWSMMRRYGYHLNEPHEDKLPIETPEALKVLILTYLKDMGFTRKSLIEYLRLFEEPFSDFFDVDVPRFRIVSSRD